MSLLRQLLAAAAGRPPSRIDLGGGRAYVLLCPREVKINLDGPNVHLESEGGRAYRSQIAMELLDPDVYGFMLLLLRTAPERPEISFRAQTKPEWIEAFKAGIAQVTLALPS